MLNKYFLSPKLSYENKLSQLLIVLSLHIISHFLYNCYRVFFFSNEDEMPRNHDTTNGFPSSPLEILCCTFAKVVIFVDSYKVANGLPAAGPSVVSFNFMVAGCAPKGEDSGVGGPIQGCVESTRGISRACLFVFLHWWGLV